MLNWRSSLLQKKEKGGKMFYVVSYEEYWADKSAIVPASSVKAARAILKDNRPAARKLRTTTLAMYDRDRQHKYYDSDVGPDNWQKFLDGSTMPLPGWTLDIPMEFIRT